MFQLLITLLKYLLLNNILYLVDNGPPTIDQFRMVYNRRKGTGIGEAQ